jgi:hypothetical protein
MHSHSAQKMLVLALKRTTKLAVRKSRTSMDVQNAEWYTLDDATNITMIREKIALCEFL